MKDADAFDHRMLAMMRVVLALSACVVTWVDPPDSLAAPLGAFLAAYLAYALAVAWQGARRGWARPLRALHWIDTGCYAVMLVLHGGAGSIFFNLFLFAVLAAAFAYGFREALYTAAASLLAFLLLCLLPQTAMPLDSLDRQLMRIVYLSVIGFFIAYWGGQKQLLRARLALLSEINDAGNARTGKEQLIGANLRRLRQFYRARSCLLILRDPTSSTGTLMYQASPQTGAAPCSGTEAPEPLAGLLLNLPDDIGACYRVAPGPGGPRRASVQAVDALGRSKAVVDATLCAGIANLLEAPAFMTAPYRQRDGITGRLYLVMEGGRMGRSDILFMLQAVEAFAASVSSVALVEEMIGNASEQERQKLSRNLHDVMIQPYIALKMALDGLLRQVPQDGEMMPRLKDIVDMAAQTLQDMRSYASGLRKNSGIRHEMLIEAIRGQARRLKRFYDIQVELRLDIPVRLSDGLATEVLHIVSEALSNILRHTSARHAFVHICQRERHLLLRIGNESQDSRAAPAFTPASIRERSISLGGSTLVEHGPEGYTTVSIQLPLTPPHDANEHRSDPDSACRRPPQHAVGIGTPDP